MKVLLVYPNDRMDNLIPVGISVLSAHLKAAGHEVVLYDTTFFDTGRETGDSFREDYLQVHPTRLSEYGIFRQPLTVPELQSHFRSFVELHKPQLIGFSSLEITYEQTRLLLEAISGYPAPRIVGGLYPTFAPQKVLENPNVDFICEGEGEEALVALANAIERGEDLRQIPSITAKTPDGAIYRSQGVSVPLSEFGDGDYVNAKSVGLRQPDIDMSRLEAPDYSIYDKKRFFKPMGGKVVRTVAMELSRGCPYKCTFCCVPMLQLQHKAEARVRADLGRIEPKHTRSFHREKPISKFIDEARSAIRSFQIDFIYFTDESFLTMSNSRFEEFVETYKTEIGIPFFIESRVETVKQGMAQKLEAAGCAGIAMGVESGDESIRRKFLGRLMSNETVVAAFKEFEGSNVRVSANNIIGFPFETREAIFETIEVNRHINPDNTVVNSFRPYTGTPLRQLCIEKGLIQPGILAADNRDDTVYYNGHLSEAEIGGIRRCFPLYVKFDRTRWPQIREAETNDDIYNELAFEFRENFLLNRFDQAKQASEIFDDAGLM